MNVRSHRIVMSLAVFASLVLHALVLIPSLVAAASAEARYTDLHETMDEEQPVVPEKEEERLGLDESNVSTMTWVGYDTYKEHLAQLSEFDQAEFVDASAPITATTEGEQPGRPARPGATATPVTALTTPAAGGAPIDGRGETGGGQPSTGQGPLSPIAPGAPTKPAEQPGPAEETEQAEKTETADKPQPKPEAPGNAPESGGGGTPSKPSDEPTPPAPNASKKESDATSTISVPREKWLSGRPLASQGLELTPKKPVFTSLQTISGAANMLVVIRFGNDGKPTEAVILRSSGGVGIDTAVLASLYRWRAKGERLNGLTEDGTIDVKLELIMTRKRR